MSRIDKLSISGVRSFSPNHKETIQFNTPLTLIVGYNGSGKTTIIECLKYVTTGEMPPNSKGGAFVHDPKLCGEKEVLAQVKLSFKSTNGVLHVVTRSMQVILQKTKKQFKTLDGSLSMKVNGERTQVSHRVAKLDEMVTDRLGVSSAILDAVIFCHQDESLWPMSEPSVLKKKFDEIFEAQKYTKAIDNLKTLRKKYGEELKRLKLLEDGDRVNKDKGDKCEKHSIKLQQEIEEARNKCEEMTEAMGQAQDNGRKKHEQAQSFLRIVTELNNKKEQLDYRASLVGDLKATLAELSDDDDTLQRELEQYEERLATALAESERYKSKYSDLQRSLSLNRNDLGKRLAEEGKHQSDKEKYERQLKVRMELIRQAAIDHGFRGYDGEEFSDGQVQAFSQRIQKLLADKGRDLKRTQDESSREVEAATSSITALEGRKAARLQDRLSAKQRSAAIDKRKTALQTDINQLDVDEGAKALLDHQSKEVDDRLKQTQLEFESASWDGQIRDENENLWRLESQHEKLQQELVDCTRLAADRAQLDFRKKELADKKRKLDTVTNTWRDKIVAVVEEDDWSPETVESQYQESLKRQGKLVANAHKARDQARKSQQMADFGVKSCRKMLGEKTQDASDCEKAVVNVLTGMRENMTVDDFQDELSAIENEVDTLKNELSLFDALSDYYKKCKAYLDSKSRCLLCDRSFDDKDASSRARLVAKIEKQLSTTQKKAVEDDLAESSAQLNKLVQVRSRFETYQRLMAEIPTLKEECKSSETLLDTQEQLVDNHDGEVAAAEGKQKDMESLGKTVNLVGQIHKEIKDSESQIERVMSQQSSSASGGGGRSTEEIHELQTKCSEQMRVLKSKIAKLTTDRQRTKDQLSALELEKSEVKNRMSHADRQLERKKDLQNQIEVLKDDQAHQREAMQTADGELESVEMEIAEARSAREEVLRRCRAKEQTVVEERDAVGKTVSELRLVEVDIREYVDGGGPSKLAANQRTIDGLGKAIGRVEKEMEDVTARANVLREDMDNGDSKKRNIHDNLNYRKNLRILDGLRNDIRALEERRADEDYDRLVREARGFDNRYNRLLADRGSMMGSMKSKDEELGRLVEEWEQDYKDAARRFRESHIKVETTKAAIADLGQYSVALDKAIMQYHSLKMEEINRIAGELWQATYQGTDIDAILIRSDAEGVMTDRRSYNYRLCMVKQDTEMDMRGRCSAGQKVLASIIIRLALAESFGANCGLVALDEPTTNLDSDNIKSLAQSLHSIIQARRAQANLQLIVITHDEEFLRHMRCSDFCDGFFRVRRDDRQNSVISKESITTVV